MLITFLSLLFTIIYIVYLVAKPKHNHSSVGEHKNHILLDELKLHANSYTLDFDSCEFKDSSYVNEVEEDNSDARIAGLLVGSSVGMFNTAIVKEETIQSVLFYRDAAATGGKRFFQTFSMDSTTLKYHVLSGHVHPVD